MTEDHGVNFSDEDEQSDNGYQVPEMQGTLSKWTNYIHGWQSRFIVFKDGTLSYYKSEQETGFGCRGAIGLSKATVKPHEFDECRFDVSVNDCVWYLRADNHDWKEQWVSILESYKQESGYGSENNLKRHGSAVSLTSNTLSTASTSSFRRGRGLKEKLAEMETFRDILVQQIDVLQGYFDSCAEANTPGARADNMGTRADNVGVRAEEDAHNPAVDFKGEALTFKATTSGVLSTLHYCLELVGQREDMWHRRMEREVERRRRVEELYRVARKEAVGARLATHGSPDYESRQVASSSKGPSKYLGVKSKMLAKFHFPSLVPRSKFFSCIVPTPAPALAPTPEPVHVDHLVLAPTPVMTHGTPLTSAPKQEGPHSTLNDEEFYDAVETGLDKLDEDVDTRDRLKKQVSICKSVSKASQHRLWPEIEQVSMEQLHYARLGVGEGGWQLFAEDGEMKMYRREEEVNGLVVDPLKACHVVRGVTGHEMCRYFFSPDVRTEWEHTLEQMTVVETIADDTLVFLQVHKRIWPASQRDALFWSHMRQVPDSRDKDAHDIWIVCNHSTELEDFPANTGKCVRVYLTVSLVCQTFIDPPKDGAAITRDDLTCKITYCSVVNPGGWAPASVLRAVYKREYPKFLKRFTAYVFDRCKDKPILF